MKSSETRKLVENVLKEFHASKDPDRRLTSLQKISQLVEDTTDEELLELASVVAEEEDSRLKGEICYTISRSRRPHLIRFVKNMVQDKDEYVRHEAISAISKLDGIDEATLTAIEPLITSMNELKSTLVSLEKELRSLHREIMEIKDEMTGLSPDNGAIMNERMQSWETYLRHEKDLLENHKGKYVAIYKTDIIGIESSDEKLAKMIYDKYGSVEALICRIEEEDEEPIQLPIHREIVDI